MLRRRLNYQGFIALLPRAQNHKDLVDGVVALAKRIQADTDLAALIRRKFAIKCTTGYSLNALVDFPVRIWDLAAGNRLMPRFRAVSFTRSLRQSLVYTDRPITSVNLTNLPMRR